MKIAVVGKGGVGKTTLCAALARSLADRKYQVLAVDADPDANLASALPLDDGYAKQDLVPLALQKERIHQIVNPEGSLAGGLLLLNPDLSDLLSDLTVHWGKGQRLVVMGWHKGGGQGCYCEENIVLQQLLESILHTPEEMVLIDSEAGLEQLSRGTVGSVDVMLIVIEPGKRSVDTAFSVKKLADDLGIARQYVVLNGYANQQEIDSMQHSLGRWPITAAIPYLPNIRQADLLGQVPEIDTVFAEQITKLITVICTDVKEAERA